MLTIGLILITLSIFFALTSRAEFNTYYERRNRIKALVEKLIPEEQIDIKDTLDWNDSVKSFRFTGGDYTHNVGDIDTPVWYYDGFVEDRFRMNFVQDYTDYRIHGDADYHNADGEGKAAFSFLFGLIGLFIIGYFYGESIVDTIVNPFVNTLEHLWRICLAVWSVGDRS